MIRRSLFGSFERKIGLRALPWLALLLCAPALGQSPTVALDLSGLDAAAYRRLDAVQLESRALLRLVQEGFAVVGPGAQPTLTIRVSAIPGAILLEGRGGARRVVPLGDELPRELQLEVAQKIVDLARESLRGWADAGVPDAGASPPPDAGPAGPTPVHPPKAELSIGGGALYRGGDLDPRGQLDVRLPLGRHLAVNLLVAVSSSRGIGISVLEPELVGGIGYRFELGESWTLEPRLLVGASLHVYSLEDPTAADVAGSRLDFLLTVPICLVWNSIGNFILGVHLAPGFSSRAREHFRQGRSIWRREAARLEFGITAGWRF